ncbi:MULTISPECIES: choline ABC transporter substrate-binding protein [unclassified Marinobacter]|jgi:glycine betaine/proline transport system substrate-binding protein|uniref:choline ABC transporter substrate-binding protein n=1 Tax=unclassified Marinobacter TaxID=83889 RepID=UPI00200F648B|nr:MULTISPECIES: choline ABC transporter substrate-binding protein [unclassified Marinobacter]MCL1478930.1 choline ABC transporter substrate-binding protein [Marinobacter sp.]MCL1480620.1 choline ABC transporter substrate-binding protein [Marinobacter sp.]MCL1484183.1 choline ABC transporter substrate-binding protein [Marinobacter sp.]MCL1487525.1 choline ABC transporter substrate-binding protein [Marinobacter sp.]UQG57747.1 choline ABC transporter substrate-binding protein [Marinobacter sp. M
MKKLILACAGLAISGAAVAAPNTECQTVRFADVGWTDITATTALASEVLEGMGYESEAKVLSVPVAYRSLKNKDIDVFLGNWMPTMEADVRPYLESGDVETILTNLEGAKYTLAVPQYVYDAGVTSFADIAKHADQFDSRIYGIEPGNDGNRLIQDMLGQDAFGLGEFRLVESSEAGMLSQVGRAVRRNEWVVFLGWEPHPMNANHDLAYLNGGDDFFGPNYGGATVHTNVRKNYLNECPNVGKLLTNMTFSLPMENEVMGTILNDGEEPRDAAHTWLANNPAVLDGWLKGVTTLNGDAALPAVKASLK